MFKKFAIVSWILIFCFLTLSSRTFSIWDLKVSNPSYQSDLWEPNLDTDFIYLQKAPKQFHNQLRISSNKYDIEIKYLIGVISVESGWREKAINYNTNKSKDIGLVQANSVYINYYSDRFFNGESFNPYNPNQSIEFCALYLNWLREYFDGDMKKALMAYNIGPNSLRKGKKVKIGEKYYQKIMDSIDFSFNNY